MYRGKKYKKAFRIDPIALIPTKAQTVLSVIGVALLLIVLRTWHLAVIEHEEKVEEASRPQKKIVLEPSRRGTIRDRFNLPLAINKIHYQATVVYSQLAQIPSVRWEKQPDGTNLKKNKRRDYIRKLAETLALELNLDANRVEDLIHSKAALYHHVPFLIKDDLTEQEYYRLKILEKDWIGLNARRQPRRHYPQGRVAADIVGYMGAINRQEYEKVLTEIRTLEEWQRLWDEGEDPALPEGFETHEQALTKLLDLKEKAYSINDFVGKMGIEGKYEQTLRGFQGQKAFTTDARGNFVRELPGSREPLPGKRLLLSISTELQTFAEELLIINDHLRNARISTSGSIEKSVIAEKQPWIKGGSIIAMDPNNGEIIALASYPRYNPNDFVAPGKARKNILRWFETEDYLAGIWEQRHPLMRENYDIFSKSLFEEELWMTWNNFLDFTLPLQGPLRQAMEKIVTINDAIVLQRNPRHERYLKGLESDRDKILILDLSRLAVWESAFDDELLAACGEITLTDHHDHCCAASQLRDILKQHSKVLFSQHTFAQWKKENEKAFLGDKRKEEKQQKKYPKPYIDLLDAEEKEQFEAFWDQNFHEILSAFLVNAWGAVDIEDEVNFYLNYFVENKDIQLTDSCKPLCQQLIQTLDTLSPDNAYLYLATLRGFQDLQRPLLGKYRPVRRENSIQQEKHLAMSFYPLYGFGYGRSHAYRQATTQGSIFKLVTAYAGLIHQYLKNPHGPLNPLTITDSWQRQGSQVIVGFNEDNKPIPQLYKGGRLPKSLNKNIGLTDIIKAIAYSSNPYFSLLAGDILSSPEDLAEAARLFSYGSPTGIDLPGEIGGNIPTDLATNRTGLYATAIGQHSLVVTPLQAAVMLSALANGGKVVQPKLVYMSAGKHPLRSPFDITAVPGNDWELQALPTIQRHEAFMPKAVRAILLEGMHQVVVKSHQSSIKQLKKLYRRFPEAIKDYEALGQDLLGKTSTAESVEAIDLEVPDKSRIYNHLWYGGILFHPQEKKFLFEDKFGKPELVVVVYLRYGSYGKDTAPLAAQVALRWRQIKAKHLLSEK
jgi:cell division protein FtsI/penicillin-binding protein 2